MTDTKVGETALPWRIQGWAGEHDEAGASIVDADGRHVASTYGGLQERSPIVEWRRYRATPRLIVTAVNAHAELIEALRALVDLNYAQGSPLGDYGHVASARALLARVEKEEGNGR
jgi:hypothetical protein